MGRMVVLATIIGGLLLHPAVSTAQITRLAGSLLVAGLGFALVGPGTPELTLLHRWLDTWTGLG